MKTSARLGIAALAVLLVSTAFAISLALPGTASTAGPVAPAATKTFTLYGDAADGWGTTTTDINNPGPSLTVAVGDTVTIHLYSNDSPIQHDWFIDFNNNNVPDAGEPGSATFSSATTAVDFSFTVPTGHIGTYTYRCRFHPTTMTGSITIQAAPPAPTFTLYGNAADGWSLTNASGSFSSPGPVLTVNQGQNVTVQLVSADGVRHDFFIDLNNNSALDGGESASQDFTGAGRMNFSFTLNTPGTYVYRCRYHPTTMWGMIVVKSTAPPPSGGLDYTLYAAVIVAVVLVAIAVGLLMKRKPRSPPQVPPQQP